MFRFVTEVRIQYEVGVVGNCFSKFVHILVPRSATLNEFLIQINHDT